MRRIIAFPELTGRTVGGFAALVAFPIRTRGSTATASMIWKLAAGGSLVEASEAFGLHHTNASVVLRSQDRTST
jgi:hypothetical protein